MPKDAKERRRSKQADWEDAQDEDRETRSSSGTSANMLQMTAELLPKFSGRDNTYPVTRWVDDVESNAEIFGWSPLQQLLVARRALTGTAELWLRAERPYKSWDELKTALIKEFPDTVDVKAVHELMSARKKGAKESCLDYMLTMKELGKRGKMPDYVAIKYIVDGIIDVEINKVMLYGVTTYAELKEKLKIYEMIRRKAQDQQKSDAEASSKQLKGKRIRCYGCGEVGHASNDCPHKDKGLKCFKCNEFGHVGLTCTKTLANETIGKDRKSSGSFGKDQRIQPKEIKRTMFGTKIYEAIFTPERDVGASSGKIEDDDKLNDDTKNVDVEIDSDSDSDMSIRTEVMQVVNKHRKSWKKPIIPVKINGYYVKALVDSGSDVNILSSTIYDALGSPKCENDELTLTGLGLSTVRSMGKCCLNMCVDKQYYDDVKFHVISSDCVPYDAIIGQEFLMDVTVVMDRGCVRFMCKEWSPIGCYASDVCPFGCVIGPMVNSVLKQEVIQCVENCKPVQVRETSLQLKIVPKDEIPAAQLPRRLSLKKQEIVEHQMSEWLEKGIIRGSYHSGSPWVLAKKKDGSTWLCGEYRKLNKNIAKRKLKDAKTYSDLKKGFSHLTFKVSEDSIGHTSVVTHHGQSEFLYCALFGLPICPYFKKRKKRNCDKNRKLSPKCEIADDLACCCMQVVFTL